MVPKCRVGRWGRLGAQTTRKACGNETGPRPKQAAACRSGSGLMRTIMAGHSPVQWAKEKTGRRLCSLARLCHSRHGGEKRGLLSPGEMGQQSDREKTQQSGDGFALPLKRSCGSASTLSSVACSCSRAVKSGPCSGQRQNIQSSPC